MRAIYGIFISLIFLESGLAAKSCGRTATINHQEIPLEIISGGKGDGLRSYLEKDKEAMRYFDLYQERNRIHPFNTLLGIVGPGFLLTGLALESRSEHKKTFLTWGSVLVVTNFLVTKTIQGTGELYLEKAVEEYNKRNSPKIDLNFHAPKPSLKKFAFMIKKGWSF